MKKQKGSERNILNKWFQDSIKNYFLETYASPFLKNELGDGFVKKVKQAVEKRMSGEGLKFMNLLCQYKIELENFGKTQRFVNSLISIVIDDTKLEQGSALWAKQTKKKFVALMLIVLMDYNDSKVSSFYDMWNFIFPSEAQIKKKLSKEDKMRLKFGNTVIPIQQPTFSSSSASASSSTCAATTTLIPSAIQGSSQFNSSSTLGYQQFAQSAAAAARGAALGFDTASQCSRTYEFQDMDHQIPNNPIQHGMSQKRIHFETHHKQHPFGRNHSHGHMNGSHNELLENQPHIMFAQSYGQFPPQTQPASTTNSQIFLHQQPCVRRNTHHSSYSNATNFLSTPDIFRRMSSAASIKQESTEQELLNLDEQQFFIDRSEDLQQHVVVPHQSHHHNHHLALEHHQLFQNWHPSYQQQQQQPQPPSAAHHYPFSEQISQQISSPGPAAIHLSTKGPSRGGHHQMAQNGYFANSMDMHNYFGVDPFFQQPHACSQNPNLF